MNAMLTARRDRSKPIDWIQIGSIAGPTIQIPSVALRSTNLRIMGSGQGSVSAAAIVAELPSLADEILAGRLPVDVEQVPLSQVEHVWNAPVPAGRRVVFMP